MAVTRRAFAFTLAATALAVAAAPARATEYGFSCYIIGVQYLTDIEASKMAVPAIVNMLRKNDDFPAPDAPRMTNSRSKLWSRTRRIWSIARTIEASRPKKTAASLASSARKPG